MQPKPGHRNEFVKQFAILYGRVALLMLLIYAIGWTSQDTQRCPSLPFAAPSRLAWALPPHQDIQAWVACRVAIKVHQGLVSVDSVPFFEMH